MTSPPNERHWVELDKVLQDRGLTLSDISRDSKRPEHRTVLSIQYLTNLRAGRRGYPQPNNRVLKQLTDAIGCTAEDLKRQPVITWTEQ